MTAEFGHPGTAALAGAGVEVHVKDADYIVAVLDFEGTGLFVIGGQVGAFGEGETVEFVGHHEGAFADAVEREIGAYFGIVEGVAFGTEFLAIVAPIPRLKLGTGLVFLEHGLVEVALLLGEFEGRRPNVHEAFVYVGGILGEAVVEHPVGMCGEAEDVGSLEAQVDEGVDNICVVVFALFAAVGECMPYLLAELAVGAGLHEGFPGGHVEGYLGAVFQFLAVGVGGLQNVLCEAHGERGYLLV